MESEYLVLIVDDEDSFREIASVRLQMSGFRTKIATSVPEALSFAESLQPDVVLSDVYMPPGPNGWELALELRQNPKTEHIKLAFFTSLRDPWMELQSLQRETMKRILGSPMFLSKMDDVDILPIRIAELIGNQE